MAKALAESINAAGIDWAAHWFQLVEERRIAIEALADQGPQTRFWATRADRYARRVRTVNPGDDPLTRAVRELVRSGDTLLDVGAGPGRYAIPLAAIASHVTAVEPAEAMGAHLLASLSPELVERFTVVPSTWEEAQVPPHDVVLCANVLYPIADVVPFIAKLDAHARRTCAIIIRVDQMGTLTEPLWPEIWGRSRPPEPGLLDLYNLLFALGIRANVRLEPRSGSQHYDDLDDAVGQARNQLFLPADQHDHDDRIRAYLATVLVPGSTGFDAPGSPQYALVWWDKP
jgi:hypothetical protein